MRLINLQRFLCVLICTISAMALSGVAAASSDPAGVIPVGHEQPVRAWHFVLRRVPIVNARQMVDKAASAGFNTLVVQLADGVKLPAAPWTPKPGAWSTAEFRNWVAYARQRGMTVVPEIKLLSQQNKFFQANHPGLMYNKSTYDPNNPAVYDKVIAFMDVLIELIDPAAIHIGHDEIAGHKEKSRKKHLRPGEQPLPAKLFLEHVVKMHRYLKSRDVETWMWGDMLISPDEFPGMRSQPLHGVLPGYGKALRRSLPKDIVICDWHYADKQLDYPSLATFRREGFRVLGATWKNPKTLRNFSHYAANNGADGMIATTWSYVQRKEWDVVDSILENSGTIFKSNFPDGL
jgi:hypothetical protein